MITDDNKKLAQWAMEYALKNGCQAAKLVLYTNSNSSFELRDGKMDRLQQSTENGLGLNLYVDGRFGSFSTNRLDKKELETLITNGIESTRYLAVSDAHAIIVSEETGGISVAYKGQFYLRLNAEELESLLTKES